jgi:hypothetical protein
VHPLLIALIFVVMMAAPAIVAIQYTFKPKRQPALAPHPAPRPLTRSVEGSVVLPTRIPESVPAKPNKQKQASALDRQVDDMIRRFILTS